MKDILDFLGNPTLIGLLAFALLGLFYLMKLFLEFVQSDVLPKAYNWYLERQKIVLPFAEKVLDIEWRAASFFRDGDPKFVDFRKDFVFIRPEVEQIQSILEKGRFVHIEGPPSSGKTVIALSIAYRHIGRTRKILYFARPSMLSDTLFNFLSTRFAKTRFDKARTLIIVDDVHLDVTVCSRLFSFLYNNYSNLKLLYVSRPVRLEQMGEQENWHFTFTQYMPKLEVTADAAMLPLANFYSQKKFGHPIPPVVRNVFLNDCANDLLLLGRYLREWDGSSKVHVDSLRKRVFEAIYKDLVTLRSKSPDAVRVLLILGVFYRFEIPVERAFLESTLGLNINYMIDSGEIQLDNSYLMLHHSSLAKLYSNVIQSEDMPEYFEISSKHQPFPAALFKHYVSREPRNLCDLVIGLRRAPDLLHNVIADSNLAGHIRGGLEREPNINILGWAMILMHICDKRAAWRIIEKADISSSALEKVNRAEAHEISLFIANLHQISQAKGEEWLRGIPVKTMAHFLAQLKLKHFALTLDSIKRLSRPYLEHLIEVMDLSVICDKVLGEDNLEDLKIGIYKIGDLLQGRVNVRTTSKADFAGEWTTKLSFYCENQRVIRFLSGRSLGIPYAKSFRQELKYWQWLMKHRRPSCCIVLDDGASVAIDKKYSIFPVGISEVKGEFEAEDIVEITDKRGRLIGAGISNFSSKELNRIKGLRTEIILEATGIIPNRVFDNDRISHKKNLERLQNSLAAQTT